MSDSIEVRFSGFHFSVERNGGGRFEGKTLQEMAIHMLHMGPGDAVVIMAEPFDPDVPLHPEKMNNTEWHVPSVMCGGPFEGVPHWHGRKPAELQENIG